MSQAPSQSDLWAEFQRSLQDHVATMQQGNYFIAGLVAFGVDHHVQGLRLEEGFTLEAYGFPGNPDTEPLTDEAYAQLHSLGWGRPGVGKYQTFTAGWASADQQQGLSAVQVEQISAMTVATLRGPFGLASPTQVTLQLDSLALPAPQSRRKRRWFHR